MPSGNSMATGNGRNNAGSAQATRQRGAADPDAFPGEDHEPSEPGAALQADPLAYLPCSTILVYSKGEQIYSGLLPSSNIYMVIEGKVKLCRIAGDGHLTVIDIYQPDEFFGESALLGERDRVDEAVAVEAAKLMIWPVAEIQRLIVEQPRLGMALIRLLTQRCAEFGDRIESYSVDTIDRRLARALVGFSERFGEDSGNGSIEMTPFTHELLAQYLGTAREVVTHFMGHLRSQGYLEYSRRGIILHRERLREWLIGHVAAEG